MRAVRQDVYGEADVLHLRDVEPPPVGDDQVLVRVAAAGVDPGVWHLMSGRPYLLRVMGFGLRRPAVGVRGRDLAGVVEQVGAGVTRFAVGDRVFGTCETGSFAECAVASADRLALAPSGLGLEQAAALPVSGMTALQAVRDAGRVTAGQRVMVIGAGGGVGHLAVQFARDAGAHVTAVCSAAKADLVRSLGAEQVIDYALDDVDRDGAVHDVIIDTAGQRPLSLLRRALTPDGTLVLVGAEHAGGPVLGGFDRQLRAPLVALFSRQRMLGLVAAERARDLEAIAALVDTGAVRPVIDRTYPLADAAAAVRYQHAGHVAGKVVVVV